MRKVAIVFVLAVFVPSLVLAWLAMRSLRDQQFVLERQRSLLYQNVADTLAKDAETAVLNHEHEFSAEVEALLTGNDPGTIARSFDDRLRTNWPFAQVGFVVSVQGASCRLVSPSLSSRPEARLFSEDNATFLANRETAEVYWSGNNNRAGGVEIANSSILDSSVNTRNEWAQRQQGAPSGESQARKTEGTVAQTETGAVDKLNGAASDGADQKQPAAPAQAASSVNPAQAYFNSANSEKKSYRRVYPQQQASLTGYRNSINNNNFASANAVPQPAPSPAAKDARDLQLVSPAAQKEALPAASAPPLQLRQADESEANELSKAVPAEAEFLQLIGDAGQGIIARFVNNRLNVLLWYRSPRDSNYVFGAQLALPRVIQELREPLLNLDSSLRDEICVALLDDSARPVALSAAGFRGNWKHPFVATEIGEELPHWEIAAYLMDPARLTQSAHTARLTLGLLIGVLVLAIGIGSWLIVNDLQLQLRLARQKTDFVSNVSHELKTPLTSIRMFSELLADGRVDDPARQRSYLTIITAEAARLTRLINNVLDFSRIESGEKKYNLTDCDLARITRDTVESYRPHLENHGYKLDCILPGSPVTVRGDCDAIAQIIVNLVSNAEKYSDQRKEITVETGRRDGPLPFAEVRVLDRGLGVPRDSEEKIFEKFYRAHDSLASGIQGSGLGLTLARQIARAHGGDVVYEPRDGGGSCFCLRLPLAVPTISTTDPASPDG